VTEPGILEEQATDAQSRLAPPWNVIVHNDPITLMIYVTMVLRRLFGYSFPQAHSLMMEVHTRGRAIVWTGAREQAEIYVQKLHAAQLLATMEAVDE
jgi:ATP-dependent Clp protease adaptor protein ClpS